MQLVERCSALSRGSVIVHMSNIGCLEMLGLLNCPECADRILLFFLPKKPPTIVCSICKRDGHSKNDCPEDFKKIDLKPLPPMTDRFREILDIVCKRCFGKFKKCLCSTLYYDL